MSGLLWELVKVIFAPILAAFLASYITYSLSHRRFIKERWWDRKADAYGNIIGSLVGLVHLYDFGKTRDGSYKLGELNALYSKYSEARARMELVATEGDYIISKKAADTLSEFMETLDPASDGFDSMNHCMKCLWKCQEAAKSCLKVLRAEARSDLGVE
jgi:hypothetical protein